MTEVLAELVAFLKDASPLVWSALIKQVYIEASADAFWGVVWLVVAFVVFGVVKRNKKAYDDEWDDGAFLTDSPWALLYVVAGVFGLMSLGYLVNAAMWFANPEFYAIRFLLEKLGGN